MMYYADVLIEQNSNHTDQMFTYRTDIPGLKPGDKVYVPFAKGTKPRAGYVFSVSETPPEGISRFREIKEKDPDVWLGDKAIRIAKWMKQKYFCRYYEALSCFTPSGKPSVRGRERRPFPGVTETPEEIAPVGERQLTEEQKRAVGLLFPIIERKQYETILIHGVTSSGKTELYIRAIGRCLELGRNAIMLVPEIALTTQTVQRFLARFGADNIAVLHSKLSPGERYDEWMRIRRGQVHIVIGARSAVFAPMENLGVIILDEEHETTYKSDMSPKYETAEVAAALGKLHGAAVILGSATPSVASWSAAEAGRYKKVVLKERYNKTPLPEVRVTDMREELLQGNRSMFSRELVSEMERTLSERRQVILFLNRRGYSTFLSCRACGYVMKCPQCGISLTYHKSEDAAVCHFCGHREKIPETCPECESRYLKHFGAGTEKVEEAVRELFPEAPVERLDLDTSRKKGSGDQIVRRFEKGKTKVLVGTQLVAKGLDFKNVGLVGIVSADVSLNIPDFRSSERTYQLITQAAGRAGRGEIPGLVIIQTYSPEHYAILTAAAGEEEEFYRTESRIRQQLLYPPYCDLIRVVLGAETEAEAALAAEKVKASFLRRVGMEHDLKVLGPRPSEMPRAGDRSYSQFLIKMEPADRALYRQALEKVRLKVLAEKESEWICSIDVNPFSYL